ncbi:22133_t:CDS:1, partial [Cetraspora pellucida]
MKEYLYKISSEYEEVYEKFSQEFNISIKHEIYNKTLIFDCNSLKKLQENMTQLINELDNKLFKYNNE